MSVDFDAKAVLRLVKACYMTIDTLDTMMNEIQEKLLQMHEELGSWPKVAAEFDISSAMAWRVVYQDYEPKDNVIRKKLGFPIIVYQYKDSQTGRFVSKK